jgi:uncharacterized protein (TIGR04255 family)
MTVRPTGLPDFYDPPVNETALSVQFERLPEFHAVHFGLYWEKLRDRFPKTEERIELPQISEAPTDQSLPNFAFQFQAIEVPPLPRVWFVNESGTELIQLQRDRFITNWRKVGVGDQYPRFERIREEFDRDFEQFRIFAAENGLGSINISQCEVSYVNQIVAGKGWSTHSEMDKVFRVWSQPGDEYPAKAQDFGFHARFPIYNAEGDFAGRLHANVKSVKRTVDGVPMFIFDLTARGSLGQGTEFLDLGRKWIVNSFKSLTTPTMHKIWGLKP